MNAVQWITDDNYEEICEGYKKQLPAYFYDGTGRDMFVFYLSHSVSERWGVPEEEYANCFGSNKEGDNCGIRLLQEGKMNY